MHKGLAVSFILCMVLLTYLSYCLFSMPLQHVSKMENLTVNSHVRVEGMPTNVRYSSDGIRFYIQGIQIRADAVKSLKNASVIVEGYVSRYKNGIWVQALKISYAS
jgi:hypothetical protein